MLSLWLSSTMLALESQSVIGLRLMKLCAGGSAAHTEAMLMVSEKIEAALEARTALAAGGTLDSVVDRYREQVVANAVRLSAPPLG